MSVETRPRRKARPLSRWESGRTGAGYCAPGSGAPRQGAAQHPALGRTARLRRSVAPRAWAGRFRIARTRGICAKA
jgi:hypothetical protein